MPPSPHDHQAPPRGMNCAQQPPDAQYACKLKACAIQECLARNDYQQRRCATFIQELVHCCSALPEPSVHCQGFGLPASSGTGASNKGR